MDRFIRQNISCGLSYDGKPDSEFTFGLILSNKEKIPRTIPVRYTESAAGKRNNPQRNR